MASVGLVWVGLVFPKYVLVSSLRSFHCLHHRFLYTAWKEYRGFEGCVFCGVLRSASTWLCECVGCRERKECMLRLARGMCSEDGRVYFHFSTSFSGVWSEDLWFPYFLCSLYYSLDFGAQFSLVILTVLGNSCLISQCVKCLHSWILRCFFEKSQFFLLQFASLLYLIFHSKRKREGNSSSPWNSKLQWMAYTYHNLRLKRETFLTHHIAKAGLLQVIVTKRVLTDS